VCDNRNVFIFGAISKSFANGWKVGSDMDPRFPKLLGIADPRVHYISIGFDSMYQIRLTLFQLRCLACPCMLRGHIAATSTRA
jgi:hypothetical protein